jgi:hypothetical protein
MGMKALMIGTLFEQEEIDQKKNFYNITVLAYVFFSNSSRLEMKRVENDFKEHLLVSNSEVY